MPASTSLETFCKTQAHMKIGTYERLWDSSIKHDLLKHRHQSPRAQKLLSSFLWANTMPLPPCCAEELAKAGTTLRLADALDLRSEVNEDESLAPETWTAELGRESPKYGSSKLRLSPSVARLLPRLDDELRELVAHLPDQNTATRQDHLRTGT